MKDAKIIFFNPNEAANHVNKVWNDIDQWWYSKKTIDALKIFKKSILGINVNGNDEKKWLSFVEYRYKDYL